MSLSSNNTCLLWVGVHVLYDIINLQETARKNSLYE